MALHVILVRTTEGDTSVLNEQFFSFFFPGMEVIETILMSYGVNFVLFLVIIGIKHGTRITQVKKGKKKKSKSKGKKKSSQKLNIDDIGDDAALLEAAELDDQASDIEEGQTMERK